jgi:lipopolysaccharide transport system ATP-binding protein
MSDIAIRVEHLSKQYEIGVERVPYHTLREALVRSARAPIDWMRGKRKDSKNSIWALDDVSFAIKQGEAVGIIGRNGAGKSTLLKVLSRITKPTRGRAEIFGRVGSLLEIGTGFHHELTGRENIFLYGAILGMSRKEIIRKFDEIVAFAEVEKFLDTPVKFYSSGMYVRLAFAVAAHLEPEILVVDEVLAVGDMQFQKKCMGKMSDARHGGKTVLFVSHNMASVVQLCQKCVLLDKGKIVEIDDTKKVIATYLSSQYKDANGDIDLRQPTLRKNSLENSLFKWTQAKVINSKGVTTTSIEFMEPFDLVITGVLEKAVEELHIAFDLKSGLGVLVFNSTIADTNLARGYLPGTLSFTISFNPNILGPGMYSVGVGAREQGIVDWLPEAITFNVEQTTSKENKSVRPNYDGFIVYPCTWAVQHTGVKPRK